jgi:hypothetical protein
LISSWVAVGGTPRTSYGSSGPCAMLVTLASPCLLGRVQLGVVGPEAKDSRDPEGSSFSRPRLPGSPPTPGRRGPRPSGCPAPQRTVTCGARNAPGRACPLASADLLRSETHEPAFLGGVSGGLRGREHHSASVPTAISRRVRSLAEDPLRPRVTASRRVACAKGAKDHRRQCRGGVDSKPDRAAQDPVRRCLASRPLVHIGFDAGLPEG